MLDISGRIFEFYREPYISVIENVYVHTQYNEKVKGETNFIKYFIFFNIEMKIHLKGFQLINGSGKEAQICRGIVTLVRLYSNLHVKPGG